MEEGLSKKDDERNETVTSDTVAPTEEEFATSPERKTEEVEGIQLITFALGRKYYAFELEAAVEVIKPRELTEIPRIPEYIKGILSVRGEMVPVVDLKMRLGVGSYDKRSAPRLLITSVDDVKAAFMVDRLCGVEEVPEATVRSPREFKTRIPKKYLKGIIKHNRRLVRLLDVRAVLDIQQASRGRAQAF